MTPLRWGDLRPGDTWTYPNRSEGEQTWMITGERRRNGQEQIRTVYTYKDLPPEDVWVTADLLVENPEIRLTRADVLIEEDPL